MDNGRKGGTPSFTETSILNRSIWDLAGQQSRREGGGSISSARQMREKEALKRAPCIVRVSDLPRFVSVPTGIARLDELFGGGWKGVNELAGPPAVGKSAIARWAVVAARKARASASVVVLDTTGTFMPVVADERVHVIRASSRSDVYRTLQRAEEWAMVGSGLSLIVVDSVAAPHFREVDGALNTEDADRPLELEPLRMLWSRLGVPSLWINHSAAVPALGLRWAHSVRTRLLLELVDSETRRLTVLKSPDCPTVTLELRWMQDQGFQ